MNKTNKILLIIVSILVFLTTIFLTYAYFSVNVSGNEDAELITVTTGTLQLQYSEGNNQINGINIEPGWESGNKVISVKNIGTLASYYDLVWQEINNNITNGEIKIDGTCVSKYTNPSTNVTTVSGTCGNIDLQSIPVTTDGYAIKQQIPVEPNYTHEYTISLSFIETNENQNYNQGKTLIGKLGINETRAWYDAVMLSSNPDYLTTKMLEGGSQPNDTIAMNNIKSNIKLMATLNESMLYYTTETNETQDGSRVYYYAGNTEENHVIFAGFCWRIVRTNEDGSVRMRYNGTPSSGTCSVSGTQVSAGTSAYNNNNSLDYANSGSIIKPFVDNWYDTNIGNNPNYDNQVAITNFCDDKSVAAVEPGRTYYGAYNRTSIWGIPTYKCPQTNDILRLKVGLLNADEVRFVETYKSNYSSNMYLYLETNSSYWLMGPHSQNTISVSVFIIDAIGSISVNASRGTDSVLPVISLKANTQVVSGLGTNTNPWIVD